MYIRFYVFVVLSVLVSGVVAAQEFSYSHYNRKDGIAGAIVYCAAEDKDGFLWFGTENGVSRFDGTHFKNFTTANGLPDNEILKIFIDSRNRVWMLPYRNAICYYQKGQLHNAENDPLLRRLTFNHEIHSINEDKFGNIILVDRTTVYIISPDNKTMVLDQIAGNRLLITINGGLTRDSLFTFCNDIPGARRMNHQYQYNGRHFSYVSDRSVQENNFNTTIITPVINVFRKNNNLVIYPRNGAAWSIPMPGNFININKIDDSLIALCTTSGAFIYNAHTRRATGNFLESQPVNSVIRDTEDNYWFMCAGTGIFKIGARAFHHRFFRDNNFNLSVNCITGIDSVLYVGSERYLLWKTDYDVQHLHSKNLGERIVSRGRILDIEAINHKELLLGTDMGLLKLDNFEHLSNVDELSIKSISPCKDSFLVSSAQRVMLFRKSNYKKGGILLEGRSTCSYATDSIYFIGTTSGLYTIDRQNQKKYLGEAFPVLKNRIVDIRSAPDGVLWIATSGQGIAGYKNGSVQYHFTEEDGLTSNICRTIFIAGKDIWVGTDQGLSRIRLGGAQPTIDKFNDDAGLGTDIVNAVYVNGNRVYVGTINGLTYFDIKEATTASTCKLRVTGITTAGSKWLCDTTGFILPHNKSGIRFDYVGISYRSGGDVSYQYQLIGLQDSLLTTRETFLSYPTLPSGKYTLKIIAYNKFRIPSDPLLISFTVAKAFWEEIWFIITVVLLLAGSFWSLVNMRIRKLRAQNEEKLQTNNRIAELEQKALKAQMNPHFIFNSLNSIQKYVIEKDVLGANKFIADFSRLIRYTLEMSARSKISIEEEVKYLTTYLQLENARYGNVFTYAVEVDPAIEKATYGIPPMVLQPYVENSIRHGVRYLEKHTGKIVIRFIKQEAYLVCSVEDNGIGRKQSQLYKSRTVIEYQSQGMALTARRLDMINRTQPAPILMHIEDMENNEQQPLGTRVVISFPLQNVTNLNQDI
jgi:hypothetical protein